MPDVTKPVPIDESADVTHDDTAGGTDGNPHSLSAELDDTGVLRAGQLPNLAVTNTSTVTTQADLTTLTAEEGDVAIVTDQSQAYILTAADPTVSSNWTVIQTPPAPVDDVFGRTGSVSPQANDYSASQIANFASTALSAIDAEIVSAATSVSGLDTATSNHIGAANPHTGSASANHGNEAHSTAFTTTTPGDVTSANWGDYEIQKNGTDGVGVINISPGVGRISIDGEVVTRAIPDGTVGYWDLNDANDTTTAVDSEGGRDATINSGVSYDSTVVTEGSHSLNFDGSGEATLPTTFGSLLTNAHTAIVFLYDSNQSSNYDRMFSFEAEYQIALRHGSSANYEWVPGDYNNSLSIGISNIPSDTWVMMAGRTDYGAGNAELDIFEADGTQHSADGSPPSSPSSGSNTNGFGGIGLSTYRITGNLDAPTFVDRYMTDQELASYAASVL